MKSILFYESDDEEIIQDVQVLQQKEVFEKLKEICEQKWGSYKDWTFDKWWNECYEDLWLYIKEDPLEVLTTTKIKTNTFWYEKNQGITKIYKDMEDLCDQFIEKWHSENPEPEATMLEDLDEEEVLGDVLKMLEEDFF